MPALIEQTGKSIVMELWLLVFLITLDNCDSFTEGKARTAAVKEIRLLQSAEAEFHNSRGRYADLKELSRFRSGIVTGEVAEGRFGSYRLDLSLTAQGYRLVAAGGRRKDGSFDSLYSDQGGVVRIGIGRETASESSPRIDGDGTRE